MNMDIICAHTKYKVNTPQNSGLGSQSSYASWVLGLTFYLSVQTMEVGSSSRVRDLCEGIATRLQLASWDGCSLFIKITDKVSYLVGQGMD